MLIKHGGLAFSGAQGIERRVVRYAQQPGAEAIDLIAALKRFERLQAGDYRISSPSITEPIMRAQ